MGAKRAIKNSIDQGFQKTERIPVYVSPDLYDRLLKVIAYKHFKIETANSLSEYIREELILPHVDEVEKEMRIKKAVPA